MHSSNKQQHLRSVLHPNVASCPFRLGAWAAIGCSSCSLLLLLCCLLLLLQVPIKDHVAAMETVMDFLSKHVSSSIMKEVVAVGHR